MDEAQVISLIQQQLSLLLKVRVPELPAYDIAGDKMTLDDRIPVWRAADNKTVQTTLEKLKALLVNSSDEVLTPTLMGSVFIVTAGLSEANTRTFNIPVLANKEFVLRQAGYRALKIDEEYEILASGGFRLLTRDIIEGEEFEIELIDDTIAVNPGNNSGTTLFTGAISVSSNITLNFTNYGNRLIQLRPPGPVSGVTYTPMVTTLPNIEDVPDNTVWIFEAALAAYESKIGTTDGQYIYMNGSSVQEVYLRSGEYLGVYRGSDGWYVWTFDPRILQVGKQVMWGYSVEEDEIELSGGNIAKNLYPRFVNKVNTEFAASKVTIEQWNTPAVYWFNNAWTTTQPPTGQTYITVPFPFRGCFADVDANTLRLPDYRDMFPRTLGTDATQRFFNQAGGFQLDDYLSHDHPRNAENKDEMNTIWPATGGAGDLNGGGRFPINLKRTGFSGGSETRGKNIGLKAKMKV